MAWPGNSTIFASLEARSRWQCLLLSACLIGIAGLVSWHWPLWWVWLISLLLFVLLNHQQWQSRLHMLSAFNRASIQLEALQNQDYSLQAKPAFASGIARL